jgi:hypothetical protein
MEMMNSCSMRGGGMVAQHPELGPSVRLGMAARDALRSQPTAVIALDAGAPRGWSGAIRSRVGLIREFRELHATVIATYSELQDRTLEDFRLALGSGARKGAAADLDRAGVRLAGFGERRGPIDARWDAFLESLPWPRPMVAELGALADISAGIPTTLNPLGPRVAAGLLYHGYLQTMISLHVELGIDLPTPPERTRIAGLCGLAEPWVPGLP